MSVAVKGHTLSEGEKLSSSIAMTMTLVSFSMLFATLFLGYVSYRLTSEIWPPVGMQRLTLGLPTASTMIILASSLTYLFFEQTAKKKWLVMTTILGFVFMVTQLYFWRDLKLSGVYVDTTIFASMVYAVTWIHAAHVVLGLLALLLLLNRLRNNESPLWIKNIGQFWHFLGLTWFLIFVGIFVL
jgi:cytochrome c oxidase subunit 3